MTIVLAILTVIAAYLIGSIPFAYLIVRWLKGIDIRTVGSGNVGATNVGRVLGSRYFLLVFVLDLLKGLLPTLGFPWMVAALTGETVVSHQVVVALAAILGHNFPIYLGFRGGKGVATSLGALLALDVVASVSAVVAFVVVLLVTGFVSMSSVGGGLIFFAVHFLRVDDPWGRDELAMSLLTIALLVLLVVRHRANFARIAAGTEPKIQLGRKRGPTASGRARVGVVAGLAGVIGAGALGAWWAGQPSELDCGGFVLRVVDRVATGHQRADRLTFADEGRLLAVTCPRYLRTVLYRVNPDETLDLVRDIALEGRPVAVWATHNRLYILQRPNGDARHLEAGWWEPFDFAGRRVGSKFRVGFDPDDLAITSDGRFALVLTSGHAEGQWDRPDPALTVYEFGEPGEWPRQRGSVAFDQPGDDPERLTLSAAERHVVVTLRGTNQAVAVELSEACEPRLLARLPLADLDVPYVSLGEDDWVVMPVASDREAVVVPRPGANPKALSPGHPDQTRRLLIVSTVPNESSLEVRPILEHRPLGRLGLRGVANLGRIRPSGLAASTERGLLAVANRSGGSVHLVTVRSSTGDSRAF